MKYDNSYDFLKLEEGAIGDVSKLASDIIGMSPRDNHFDNTYSWVPKDYDFNHVHVEPGKYQAYKEPDEFYNLDKILIWLDPDFRRAANAIRGRYNVKQDNKDY